VQLLARIPHNDAKSLSTGDHTLVLNVCKCDNIGKPKPRSRGISKSQTQSLRKSAHAHDAVRDDTNIECVGHGSFSRSEISAISSEYIAWRLTNYLITVIALDQAS
jgi:hypothetical protein